MADENFSQLPTYISRGLCKTRSLQLVKRTVRICTRHPILSIYSTVPDSVVNGLFVCPSFRRTSVDFFSSLLSLISSFSFLPLCICPLVSFSLFLLLSSSFPPSVHLFLFPPSFSSFLLVLFLLVLSPIFYYYRKTLFSFSSSFLLH